MPRNTESGSAVKNDPVSTRAETVTDSWSAPFDMVRSTLNNPTTKSFPALDWRPPVGAFNCSSGSRGDLFVF